MHSSTDDDRHELNRGESRESWRTTPGASAGWPPVLLRFPDLRPSETPPSENTTSTGEATENDVSGESSGAETTSPTGGDTNKERVTTNAVRPRQDSADRGKRNLMSHVAAAMFAVVLLGIGFFAFRGPRSENAEVSHQPPDVSMNSGESDDWEVHGPAQPLARSHFTEETDSPIDDPSEGDANAAPLLTSPSPPVATARLGAPNIADRDDEKFGASTKNDAQSHMPVPADGEPSNDSVAVRASDRDSSAAEGDNQLHSVRSILEQPSTGGNRSASDGFNQGPISRVATPPASVPQRPIENNLGNIAPYYPRTNQSNLAPTPGVPPRDAAPQIQTNPYPVTTPGSNYFRQHVAAPGSPYRTSQRTTGQIGARNYIDTQQPPPAARLHGNLENPPIERRYESSRSSLY